MSNRSLSLLLNRQPPGLIRQGGVLWVLCGLAVAAWAGAEHPLPSANRMESAVIAPAAAESAAQPLYFNIPAQPLAAALSRYGAISDQPAVFASDIVVGRTSSSVQGLYPAETALRLLLQGTGLSFEKIIAEPGATFLLKEIGKPVARATLTAFFGLTGYPGLIQQRIQESLCADLLTAPGQYNTLFRFQLDGDGHIHNVVLLDSTGSARRDGALLSALQGVNIGLPPPPMVVEQALTMRLRRSDPDTDSGSSSPCEPQPESRQ